MNIYDFKRAVNTLGSLSDEDVAVVVSIKRSNGQIVTRNIGDEESLKEMYRVLLSVPRMACRSTKFADGSGGSDTAPGKGGAE